MRKIELLDPWPNDITGVAGSSLLAGAIVLRFDQTAVVCTSPLRYMQSQLGTFIAVPGVDCMASLGCRLTLTTQEDADLISPSALSRKVIAPKSWMQSTESITGDATPVLLLAAMKQRPQATWSVKMRFLGGSYILAWRPDLDGCIEFAPLGHRHTIDRIAVHRPADAFGWLHPAYQHPFILDENCWRSAQISDWPWPIRKALQSHHEPEKFYRERLSRALRARFRQNPSLRQRLLALRYPVQINDVPDGLIQEVAAALRKDSLAGLAR